MESDRVLKENSIDKFSDFQEKRVPSQFNEQDGLKEQKQQQGISYEKQKQEGFNINQQDISELEVIKFDDDFSKQESQGVQFQAESQQRSQKEKLNLENPIVQIISERKYEKKCSEDSQSNNQLVSNNILPVSSKLKQSQQNRVQQQQQQQQTQIQEFNLNSGQEQKVKNYNQKFDPRTTIQMDYFKKASQNVNVATQLVKVRNFIKKIKIGTSFFRKGQLKDHELMLINDSCYYQERSIQQILKRFKTGQDRIRKFSVLTREKKGSISEFEKSEGETNFIFNLMNRVPAFSPTNYFLTFWDIVHLFSIFFCTFYVPIEWVSYLDFSDLYGFQWVMGLLACLIIFVLNIFIQMQTGYYSKGLRVMDVKKIRVKYLKSRFFFDLLMVFPLFMRIFSFKQFQFLNFFMLFKLESFYKIMKKYQEITIQKKLHIFAFLIKIIKLTLNILIFGHFLGVVWLGIAGTEQKNDKPNWLDSYNGDVTLEEWSTRYIYSLYWAITTMTSVGYGDITPKNPEECIFVTMAMIAACFVFAYSFNQIGQIVEDINKREKEYRKEMELVGRYMEQNHIQDELKEEVLQFMTYRYLEDFDISAQQEKQVFEKLNEDLQKKLTISKNIRLMNNYKFLIKNFSTQTIEKLAKHMSSKNYHSNQIIYNKGDYESKDQLKLFFIEKGQVGVLYDKNAKNLMQKIGTSGFFGEKEFFTEMERNQTVRSLTYSSVSYINKEQFIEIIRQNECDYEKYCQIKDYLVDDINNYEKCDNCDRYGHTYLYCNRITYQPDKEKLLLKHNFSFQHKERIPFYRTENRSHQSLLFQPEISQAREDYLFETDESEIKEYVEKYHIKSALMEMKPQDIQKKTEYLKKKKLMKNSLAKQMSSIQEDEQEEEFVEHEEIEKQDKSSLKQFRLFQTKIKNTNSIQSLKQNQLKLMSINPMRNNSGAIMIEKMGESGIFDQIVESSQRKGRVYLGSINDQKNERLQAGIKLKQQISVGTQGNPSNEIQKSDEQLLEEVLKDPSINKAFQIRKRYQENENGQKDLGPYLSNNIPLINGQYFNDFYNDYFSKIIEMDSLKCMQTYQIHNNYKRVIQEIYGQRYFIKRKPQYHLYYRQIDNKFKSKKK